jgi:hypothetical protein
VNQTSSDTTPIRDAAADAEVIQLLGSSRSPPGQPPNHPQARFAGRECPASRGDVESEAVVSVQVPPRARWWFKSPRGPTLECLMRAIGMGERSGLRHHCLQNPNNRTSEGLSHGFWSSDWSRSHGPVFGAHDGKPSGGRRA